MEAEWFIRELEGVLERRYDKAAVDKLVEVLTPARVEGTVDLPLEVRDERGDVVARVVGLRYEFVEGGKPVGQCAGEGCRLRITAEYELPSGERRKLRMEWYWAEKRKRRGQTTATYYYEKANITVKDDVEAAVLKALTGREVKRGKVQLFAGDLEALRRFKALKDVVDQWRAGKPTS